MEKEVEEIRKFWIDPQTNRAWDIFADSSEAFGKAKKDIPALLSALEASQREAAGLTEELGKERQAWIDATTEAQEQIQKEITLEQQIVALGQALGNVLIKVGVIKGDQSLTGPQLLVAADSYCALARTEKEGGRTK